MLAVALVLFVFIWTKVAITSVKFQKQLEQMVLGKDYFIEDVVIRKKDTDIYSSGKYSLTKNYFFYYGMDKTKRMQVPESMYKEYQVGDSIPAYTTDHIYYDYEKDGILPREDFRDNELMKANGVICGCVICILALYLFLEKKCM